MLKNMTNYKLFSSSIALKIFENCDIFNEEIMIESIYWQKISGKKYKENAINYAIKLKKLWVKKWDSIVIFIKDMTKFSYICLSCLLVWAKIILIEKEYSKEILKEKLDFIKPDFLIIEKILYKLLKNKFLKKFQKIQKFSPLIEFSKNIIVNEKKEKSENINNIFFEDIDENDEIMIVFTWWTTWNPKWVVHTLKSISVMIERTVKIIWKNTNIFYADLPHFVLIWILAKAKIIVWENNISDKKFLKIIEKYNIDTTFSPPYRFLEIINSNKKIPENLHHICLGSAPVYKSFLEKIFKKISEKTKITCIYGMTEILPVAFIDGKEKLNFNWEWDILWKIFKDINFKINDDYELILWWNWLFKKYLWKNNIIWHKTWDLVEFKNNFLIMKWRKKDMIIRKDYNIYPSLYEPIIWKINWVKDSAMVWIWDEKAQDEKIFLFIEWKNLNEKNIFSELKNSIDTFALPDKIIFEKIPRKWRQNKIDKNYLQNKYSLWK